MTPITEDYVSFETAKLLKEKGFNAEIDTYYSPECKFKIWCPNGLKSYLDNKGTETLWWKCIAPTLQMAIKWLREVHKIYIEINIRIILGQWSGYDISIYTTDNDGFLNKKIPIILKDNTSYEEACEEAIKYCLENLI